VAQTILSVLFADATQLVAQTILSVFFADTLSKGRTRQRQIPRPPRRTKRETHEISLHGPNGHWCYVEACWPRKAEPPASKVELLGITSGSHIYMYMPASLFRETLPRFDIKRAHVIRQVVLMEAPLVHSD
jgi:hypothetical protein